MSYTRTLIGNIAMSHLGDREITNIDDTNNQDAVILKRNYIHARDAIYEAHDWKWAKDAEQLQQKVSGPAVRFTYAYALPANFRRLSNVSESSTMEPQLDYFDIVGGELTTDAEYVFMEFVSSKWSEALWKAYFADCVALKLASICAPRITSSMRSRDALNNQLMKEVLPQARAHDSQGQPARRRFIRSDWANARFGGRNRSNLRKNA